MFYGLPTYYEEIAKYNNIEEPYIIYEGQELLLPRSLNGFLIKKETKTFDYENDKLYIVQKNDYLLDIVKKYYGTTYNNINLVNKLATYNLLEDPNLIEVGDALYIPEIDKLLLVEENDYSIQYKRLEWRINHPGEEYPDELKEKDKELLLIKE
jgi:nucleoid-associated protein YgaU